MQGREKMHNIEHIKREICWRSYSHMKIVAAGTALSLDDEQC